MAAAALVAAFLAAPLWVKLAGGWYYSIPAGAMKPAVLTGDTLLALPLKSDTPERGSVIIYTHPTWPGVDFVKRVIGLPGDRIAIVGGVVVLNDKPAAMTRLGDRAEVFNDPTPAPGCVSRAPEPGVVCSYEHWRETFPDGTAQDVFNTRGTLGVAGSGSHLDDLPAVTIPAGHFYLLGDHRDNSRDSRDHGPVPIENIRYKVWIVHTSWDRETLLPRVERFLKRVE
ncbi:MAG: signal peptidase I [Pseudomonadota bacterium]